MWLLVIIIVIETVGLMVAILKLMKPNYDGKMVVIDGEDKKTFSLEIKTDPNRLDQQKKITLKVTNALE